MIFAVLNWLVITIGVLTIKQSVRLAIINTQGATLAEISVNPLSMLMAINFVRIVILSLDAANCVMMPLPERIIFIPIYKSTYAPIARKINHDVKTVIVP